MRIFADNILIHEAENTPEEIGDENTAGPTRTTKRRNRRQGQQKIVHRATQRSAFHPTAMMSLRSFRKSRSKHRNLCWHRSCFKKTRAQQAGSPSGWETTRAIRSLIIPHHNITTDSRESSVKSQLVFRTKSPFALSLQHNATQTGKCVVGAAYHQHPSG